VSDEHDSWFKEAFGVDLGQALTKIKDEGSAAVEQGVNQVTQIVKGVQGVVDGALDGVTQVAAGVVKKVAGAVAPSGSGNSGATGSGAGGTGSFPLGGSVGRGGKNAPNDVSAVQAALGIAADGRCGGQTIAAIEAFQRNLGQARPDGRVDAGGGTERALAGGGAAPAATPQGDPSPSLFDSALQGAKDFGGKVVKEVGDDVDAAKTFGAEVVDDAKATLDTPNIALNQATAPDAGATDAGVADAGTLPDPNFQDIDRPFNVRADDPVEFVNKGNEYLGRGIAGHMKTDELTVKHAETDSKGRVVRANLLVRTTTERPRWVAGRTIGDERAVIEQAEELIRAHEERHREIMKSNMTSAVNEMRGKSTAEADKILAKWIGNVDKQQDDLDKREGQIQIVQSGGRMTGARLVPR
jgi:hypothetical protein